MKELTELSELVGLPVCIDEGEGVPEGDTCFVVAKNGFYKLFKSGDVCVSQKMDKLPGAVKTMDEGIQWVGPKIPAELLDFICNIFIDFHRKTGNELNMHIWHSPTTGFWLNVPVQEVTPTASDWDDELGVKWIHDYKYVDNGPADGRRIGNVHSHHTMMPEWSSKDRHFQEKIEFGIQLVVGMIDRGRGVSSRVAFNGKFVDVPLEDVIDFGERRTLDIPDEMIRKLPPPMQEKEPDPKGRTPVGVFPSASLKRHKKDNATLKWPWGDGYEYDAYDRYGGLYDL